MKIGNAWETFVQQALAAGYLLGNQGREVYKDWHAFDSNVNLTELQMDVVGRNVHVV